MNDYCCWQLVAIQLSPCVHTKCMHVIYYARKYRRWRGGIPLLYYTVRVYCPRVVQNIQTPGNTIDDRLVFNESGLNSYLVGGEKDCRRPEHCFQTKIQTQIRKKD
uniref:Uncharacterized protein n=1 Tax=Sipha flava TaxID=143950 RepID=A0A2S2RAJ8_9HEMI